MRLTATALTAPLVAAALAGIFSAPPAVARAPLRPTVCACTSARLAVGLAGRTLAGTVHIFLPGVRDARSESLEVDGRRVSTVRVHHHRLAELSLATTRLKDGAHSLLISARLRGRASASGRAKFIVANHVSAEQLIATALALHGISRGRSFLYRAYAFWHADALPQRFRGTGTEPDEAVFYEAEVAVQKHELDRAETAEVEPVIARPTSPHSLFSTGTAAGARASSSRCVAPATWLTEAGANIRVWSTQQAELKPTLEAAEKALAQEKGDMGMPLPDNGGSPAACLEGNTDSRIDVYVAEPATKIRQYSVPANDFAVTVPTERAGNYTTWEKCSGYIILNRKQTNPTGDPERLADVLTHEMYHVLQDAHNCNPGFGWFREASAQWAEIHYEPENASYDGEVSKLFNEFQGATPRALTELSKPDLAYADFTWPLFMSQEGFNPAEGWKAVEGANGESADLKKLDGVFPFSEHLAAFALRDLDIPYDEEGSTDLAPEFQTAPTDGVVTLPATQPTSYKSRPRQRADHALRHGRRRAIDAVLPTGQP